MLVCDPQIWERWLFLWTLHFSSSPARNWVKIINSLSNNLLSVFLMDFIHRHTHINVHIHTQNYIHTHPPRKGEKYSAKLYPQVGMWFLELCQPVFSCLNPESRLGWRQFTRNIPSDDLLRYFLYIISLLFCPDKFCSYNFKIISLFSCAFPIQIGLWI